MRTQFPREWAALKYRSARDYLANIAPVRAVLAVSDTDERIASLRTNKLKPVRELRQICLFAHGIGSCVLSTEVYIALVEDQDFDCVAQYVVDGTSYYTPIQIKEFVPARLNPSGSLQAEINKLRKYTDSSDLVVAFHLNRQFQLDLRELQIPKLQIAELWLFGAVTSDASELMLFGDMLKDPGSYTFHYPEPNNAFKAAVAKATRP